MCIKKMGKYNSLQVLKLPQDPKVATKLITDILFNQIYPIMLAIRNNLKSYKGHDEDLVKIQDVFVLCSSQIQKCFQTFFDIFKIEYHQHVFLQETRQCTLERLSWCLDKLNSIEEKLNTTSDKTSADCSSDSIMATQMYFVNWIDHTFEVLGKLAYIIYRTDYREDEEICDQWKNDLIDCVTTLHISLDELLLSAMTLCKYCLPSDQLVVKARCQVVLRETKALLSELIEGNLDNAFIAKPEALKLPLMPSNVNVLIDVLKDVIYALETNTNTALLALLVHCFSNSVSPIDVLKEHFKKSPGTCSCHVKSDEDVTEDCSFVKEFDLYNERLLQIGSFAVSCSSDQHRILSLRSGLASLEALDPHLVPALMLSPEGHHATLLMEAWRQEVIDIRDSVFLIVDPTAFAEKAKQMMHEILLGIINEKHYNNKNVCSVINIGCVVYDFLAAYCSQEPDALTQHEKMVSLLKDLNKVQKECKIVSNTLSSEDDFKFDDKKTNDNVCMEQMLKRLKLLYTLVSKINTLLHPKENEDLFECENDDVKKNVTHTVYAKNTYNKSPKVNMSRSVFARTTNLRSSTNNFPLHKLTKHLKERGDEISFTVQLDEMFNLSEIKMIKSEGNVKKMVSLREPSILYNYSPKKRSSLRKAVLNKHCRPYDKCENLNFTNSLVFERESLMDEATSLQITDILNQMSNMTSQFTNLKITPQLNHQNKTVPNVSPNILSININNATVSKHIWSIPVNVGKVELPLDVTSDTLASNSNVTVPSNVTTLERISDIDLVENKLNCLKNLEETSL